MTKVNTVRCTRTGFKVEVCESDFPNFFALFENKQTTCDTIHCDHCPIGLNRGMRGDADDCFQRITVEWNTKPRVFSAGKVYAVTNPSNNKSVNVKVSEFPKFFKYLENGHESCNLLPCRLCPKSKRGLLNGALVRAKKECWKEIDVQEAMKQPPHSPENWTILDVCKSQSHILKRSNELFSKKDKHPLLDKHDLTVNDILHHGGRGEFNVIPFSALKTDTEYISMDDDRTYKLSSSIHNEEFVEVWCDEDKEWSTVPEPLRLRNTLFKLAPTTTTLPLEVSVWAKVYEDGVVCVQISGDPRDTPCRTGVNYSFITLSGIRHIEVNNYDEDGTEYAYNVKNLQRAGNGA